MKRIKENNSGEIMIESTVIISMTLMLLIALIGMGFLIYQQAMLSTVASEAAIGIARNYKYTNTDLDNATISLNDLTQTKKFRTSLALNSMRNLNKSRVEDFVNERVDLTNLSFDEQNLVVDEMNIEADNIGRLHVEVTISMQSEILFGGALEYFGISEKMPKLSATARAECVDISAYAGHVRYAQYVSETLEKTTLGKTVDHIVDIVNNIRDIINTFL